MTTPTTDAEAIARIIRLAMYDSSASEGPDELSRIAGTYASAILSYLASRREAKEPVQITMQDVRLMAGEGPLTAKDTLAAVNAHLRRLHRHTAPPAPAGEAERLTPNERFIPRMLLLDDLHAVCVGGRWDGWKFFKHPDGQWVSLKKLEEQGADDAARATLNGGRAE